LPIGQLQNLADLHGKVTAFHVRLRPAPPGRTAEENIRQARAAIEAAMPGLKAVPVAERAHNNQFVSFARSIAWGTSLIALLVGALGIANTMAMAVFERTKEIGILRALGWKRWRVILLIQLEAAALAQLAAWWDWLVMGRAAAARLAADDRQHRRCVDFLAARGDGFGNCRTDRAGGGSAAGMARGPPFSGGGVAP